MILSDEDQVLVDVFKGLDLVMELHQDRLGRHLPVHPERFCRLCVSSLHADSLIVQKPLPLRPNRSGGVQRLQLDADEVLDFAVLGRHQKEVDAPAGNRAFRDNVQFVARFVIGQQVQAVCENLLAFEQPMRADDDRLRFAAVLQSAGSDGDIGFALPNLEALAIQERTLLPAHNLGPFGNRFAPSVVAKQLNDLVRHSNIRQR